MIQLKLDEPLEHIRDPERFVRFECKTPNCHFATTHSSKLFLHEQGCRSETEIICKQIPMHRPSTSVRDALVAEGILPDSTWHNWHFATFDVECFMDDQVAVGGIRSTHRLVCAAIKSSFGDKDSSEHYLQRENMDPWAVKGLVQEILSTLIHLRAEMFKYIPTSVIEGRNRYSNTVRSKDFRKRSVERQAIALEKLRFLDKCLALRIYSFNGERYDHNVIWAPLMDVFTNMDDTRKSCIIRRGTGIMEFTDGALVFRDFLNMTCPMSLERFAKSCGITEVSKTTFPYEEYRDITNLRTIKEFPPYDRFRSSLSKSNDANLDQLEKLVTNNFRDKIWETVDDVNKFFGFNPPIRFVAEGGQWSISKDSITDANKIVTSCPKKYFESKKIFSEECLNMEDYLRIYNLNDVILLDKCIKAYAKGFFDSWGVNIHENMSLPGVAQKLAFQFYDEEATAIYTFGKKFQKYNEEIRSQLHGGMTLGTGIDN